MTLSEPQIEFHAALDNGGQTPTGAKADTWYDEGSQMKVSPDMLEVQAQFERGEIDQDEATRRLDVLAAKQES